MDDSGKELEVKIAGQEARAKGYKLLELIWLPILLCVVYTALSMYQHEANAQSDKQALAQTLKESEKVPRTRVLDVMQEAAQNPRFMAALLEKPTTPAAAKQVERQINAFLIQAGLVQREQSE